MERHGPRDSRRNQETPICWWLNRRGNHDCKGERKEDGNAAFELHKWHSNIPQLESDKTKQSPEDQTYAKQQLGIPEGGGGAILSPQWDKQRDASSVAIPVEKADNTKRGVLAKIAKIYDPLGVVSPLTLCAKLFYRAACNLKVGWDEWESTLPAQITFPRAVVQY